MLNPNSPIPLYHQLADALMEQIRSGTYEPGAVIPSENGMARHYNIGRPTVRQAMDILVRKGLVERKRGSGTFVKKQMPQVDLFSLAGTSQAFLTKGIETRSTSLEPVSFQNVQDDGTNPFNGGTAFFYSRLTLVKDEPILMEEFYLLSQLFPGLDRMDLENRSLAQVVYDHYYLKPVTGRQRFKIASLPDPKAKSLGITPSDPILEVERTLDFPGAKKAIFSRLFCRTDNFAFSQTIHLETN